MEGAKKQRYKENSKMGEVNPTSLVFKFNLKELKTPIEIQLAEWIKINDITICC